jgi:hypothetical protein
MHTLSAASLLDGACSLLALRSREGDRLARALHHSACAAGFAQVAQEQAKAGKEDSEALKKFVFVSISNDGSVQSNVQTCVRWMGVAWRGVAGHRLRPSAPAAAADRLPILSP